MRDIVGTEASAPASASAWRRSVGAPSLAEVYRSVAVKPGAPGWRKAIAFLGPGYLVAVGYMDPGNWATSLAGGAQVRLRAARHRAALQHHGDRAAVALCAARPSPPAATWRRPAATPSRGRSLWRSGSWREIAIVATDLAEVIGTAIGLNLLFGIPLAIGVVITASTCS